MQKKAFVLLSGGMDSTTCLFQAIFDYMPRDPGLSLAYGDIDIWKETLHEANEGDVQIGWVEAVSINYGQRHKKEMDYAKATCQRLGIKHTILDLGDILKGESIMLSENSKIDVPDIDYSEIKGVSPTFVPYRNGLMLSVLTVHAQKWVNTQVEECGLDSCIDSVGIYAGMHSEDAANWAYPDCTPEWIGAMSNAIYIGTYRTIRLHTPLQWLVKADIVALGDKLGVPFETTWSCYKGEEKHCGVCPTCRSRKQAFIAAEVQDPTPYAKNDEVA